MKSEFWAEKNVHWIVDRPERKRTESAGQQTLNIFYWSRFSRRTKAFQTKQRLSCLILANVRTKYIHQSFSGHCPKHGFRSGSHLDPPNSQPINCVFYINDSHRSPANPNMWPVVSACPFGQIHIYGKDKLRLSLLFFLFSLTASDTTFTLRVSVFILSHHHGLEQSTGARSHRRSSLIFKWMLDG